MKTVAVIPSRFFPPTLRQLLTDLTYLDEHDDLIVIDDSGGHDPYPPLGFQFPNVEIWRLESEYQHRIYGMWNWVWAMVLEKYPDEEVNLAFLNDDITIPTQEFLAPLATELRANPDRGVVCPDYRTDVYSIHHGPDVVSGTYREGGICGWAFMVAAEWRQTRGVPPIDEQFIWWCGDDDLVHQYQLAGAQPAILTGLSVAHVGEFSARQVPELHDIKHQDLIRFQEKYA